MRVTFPRDADEPRRALRILRKVAGTRGAATLRRVGEDLYAEAASPDERVVLAARLPGAVVSDAGDAAAWSVSLAELSGDRIEGAPWPPPRDPEIYETVAASRELSVAVSRTVLLLAARCASHACSDATRPDTWGVWLDPEAGSCWATDGHRLAAPPSLELWREVEDRCQRVPAGLLSALVGSRADLSDYRVSRGLDRRGVAVGTLFRASDPDVLAVWRDGSLEVPPDRQNRAGSVPSFLRFYATGYARTYRRVVVAATSYGKRDLREIRRADLARVVAGRRPGEDGEVRALVQLSGDGEEWATLGVPGVHRPELVTSTVSGAYLADALELVGEVREVRHSGERLDPLVLVGYSLASVVMPLNPGRSA